LIEALREQLTECEFAWRRQVAAAPARTVPEHGRV
jgi:hypothetical protein